MSSFFNKDMLYTILNQLWRVVAGPMLLLCIPWFLTAVEQGYWYTFTSIAALAVFADLGFSNIVLQFTAHEFARLSFDEAGKIQGDEKSLWRLASFLRFCIRWLSKVIGIVFPLIVIGGWMFLSTKENDIMWQGAWFVYASMSAVALFNAAMLSFFEGCNSVALAQRIRMIIAMVNSGIIIMSLVCHAGLWALALGMTLSSVVGFFMLWRRFHGCVGQLWSLSSGEIYNWWPEFSRLIWRYAISWCSGYFIFQLFVPLAFKSFGPEYAGMVGMSIAAWTAGFNIASSWLTSVVPRINVLIELRRWQELDKLFNTRMLCVMGTMILGGLGYGLIYLLFGDFWLFRRLLPIESMGLLFACWLCQSWVNTIAVYLRGHKEEPLMALSAVSAVYVAVTTYLCAMYLPKEWLFAGFFSSYIWGIPVVYMIYRRYKQDHRKIGISL